MSVYIIRHGETEWALTGQHTGLSDIPLTEHGEEEARRLIPLLTDIQFEHIYSSPLQRARRTAELALPGAKLEIDPELVEWNYGDFEGITSADIVKTHRGWSVFRDGCPNGESPSQISERADRLITRLQSLGGDVLLVSHGQFGSVLSARWIGLPVLEADHFPLDTASLSVLSFSVHHPDVPVIKRWNITPNQ